MNEEIEKVCEQYNAALNFALDICASSECAIFLCMWREGDWHGIKSEFPEFEGPFPE